MLAPKVAGLQSKVGTDSTTTPSGRRKLAIGPVDDPFEQEADRVADLVTRAPVPESSGARAVPRPFRRYGSSGQASELQTKRDGATEAVAGDVGGVVHAALNSPGQPLDAGTRAYFEPRFGYDFSRVRVHTDASAAESARAVSARAFTVGNHIVFAGQNYAPHSPQGRRLVAHELTHVAQQGYATVIGDGSANIASGRAAPAIQRDKAQDSTESGVHLSITKRYDPFNASRDEVVQALTDYLDKELALQGGRSLAITDRVRLAVLKLFQDDPVRGGQIELQLSDASRIASKPDSPASLAATVEALLPDTIPRKHMMHLYKDPVKREGPTSVADKARQKGREELGKLGKPQQATGEVNRPVESPGTVPTMGSSEGQHIFGTPELPFGDVGSKRPKRAPPPAQSPTGRDPVEKVVQSLDDAQLIPAEFKGKPQAANFAGARDLARTIAAQIAEAQANKRSTVRVVIGAEYRSAADLREIFDRIENIVRQIAAALPGGAKDVDEVIISTPASKAERFPPQRRVPLRPRG